MNTGVLSACLPTFRPLLEAYPISPTVSKLLKQFSDSFLSTIRPSSDVHLGSMERGLNEVQCRALGVNQNTAYATYAGNDAGPKVSNGRPK